MTEDYLGKAAVVGREITAAIKAGEHDKAWRLLHEKQVLYTKHASRWNFGRVDTLTILSGIHGGFAEILKLEGKHADALVHVLYMVASDRRQLKKHTDSLRIYFNRCKLKETQLDELMAYSETVWCNPDFQAIQSKVSEWIRRG